MNENILKELYAATKAVTEEIRKVIIGKEDVIDKVMMSILANGHILLDDVPGVGKTSLAVSFGKALGMNYNRIQFTPDVLPSDIVGFSVFNKEKDSFTYMPGVVNNTGLLLADEINRTSSRTQAALLEAMEEKQVTVDGITHPLSEPFIVIATMNQVGAAGTQTLPHAQMDRFLTRLSIGYPDRASEMRIIQERQIQDPYSVIRTIVDKDSVASMQRATLAVTIRESMVSYIADLVAASRNSQHTELGISPRGAIAVSHMAKAAAIMSGRDYVVEEDVRNVFCDVCAHRMILTQKARAAGMSAKDVLEQILGSVKTQYSV